MARTGKKPTIIYAGCPLLPSGKFISVIKTGHDRYDRRSAAPGGPLRRLRAARSGQMLAAEISRILKRISPRGTLIVTDSPFLRPMRP
jgi:hypothetical protein